MSGNIQYEFSKTFDRMLGAIHGLPDVDSTKPTTVRVVTPMIGAAQLFTVQTYRQREVGDTVFVECIASDETIRIALPPEVAKAIARQRDALTGKSRTRIGKASAQAIKERGDKPGFMLTAAERRARKEARKAAHRG